ncbi:MAG: ABC transporter ATP-binding protein [Deltaproteobacteria bacterium]|nr:ABC transporter ATP-binding protein [Candidatus Zymogenaceae bacterium]
MDEHRGTSPLLSLRDVETRYDRLTILSGVSLAARRGDIVAILGANGAGKSTVLKTVAGLIDRQPVSGSIRFEGREIGGMDVEEIVRLGIAYVPEGRQLFSRLTVDENLRMGAYTRRDKAAVRKDYERVTALLPILAERRKQTAGTLSGGEQQMLAIARGLMSRPRLLLLDEPSLGLAPLLVADIFRIISAINDEGVTIVLVEQNARMALSIADYGYVLENGRVVLEGSPHALMVDDLVRHFYLGISLNGEGAPEG